MEAQRLSPTTCRNAGVTPRMHLVPSVQNLRPAVFLTAQVIATAGARLYLIVSSLTLPCCSPFPQQKHSESLRAHQVTDPALNPRLTRTDLCNLQHTPHWFPCRTAGQDLTRGGSLRESCRLQGTHRASLPSTSPEQQGQSLRWWGQIEGFLLHFAGAQTTVQLPFPHRRLLIWPRHEKQLKVKSHLPNMPG